MYSKRLTIIITIVLASLISCVGNNSEQDIAYPPTSTAPVIDYSLPATQFIQEAQSTVDAQAAASLKMTQSVSAQETERAQTDATATAEMHVQGTAQAEPLSTVVDQLFSTGVLTTTQGTFYSLPDFEERWAMRDFYDFALTEQTISDFVLVSTLEWDSAGSNVDYSNAGCGYVFRLNPRGDHYLIYLGADGRAYLYLAYNHTLKQIGREPYTDSNTLSGKAKILLTVQGDRIILFIDDVQVLDFQDSTLQKGYLGQAIASGTNSGYGTHCQMTDNQLWKLDSP